MLQQINLYQPVFRHQQKVFSASTLLQIVAAVLVLLTLIIGHARWTLAAMERSEATLDQQHRHLLEQITRLEENNRTPDTETLDRQIEQLTGSIDQRRNLLVQFDRLVLQNKGGFTSQFKVLAEENTRGLWLDGVTIDDQGRVELRGQTLDPNLVPAYLQQLGGRNELSGSGFETVFLQRPDLEHPQINFVLRNFDEDSK